LPPTGILFIPMWYTSTENHGGMILTGETRRTRRKPVPVPLRTLQIPHGLTRLRTRASAVRGRWLTAWAMARPILNLVSWFPVILRLQHSTQLIAVVAIYTMSADLHVTMEPILGTLLFPGNRP
jgi:hypothetical protein